MHKTYPPSSPLAAPLKCSLRNWEDLRTSLRFVTELANFKTANNRTVERRGEYSAWLMRAGSVSVRSGAESAVARPGQWLFCFGNQLTQEFSPDARLLTVRMNAAWPDESMLFAADRSLLLLNAADHPQLEPLAKQLIDDIGHVDWQNEDPAVAFHWRTRLDFRGYLRHQQHLLQWNNLVLDLLEQHGWRLQIPGGIDTRLANALDLIDHSPMHLPFPAKKLPSVSGLTIGQLNRLCRKATSLTVNSYWEQRRLQYACFRIAQPNSSIKEIAAETGFTQLSHFSAWFKRQTKLGPREYRKSGSKPV